MRKITFWKSAIMKTEMVTPLLLYFLKEGVKMYITGKYELKHVFCQFLLPHLNLKVGTCSNDDNSVQFFFFSV